MCDYELHTIITIFSKSRASHSPINGCIAYSSKTKTLTSSAEIALAKACQPSTNVHYVKTPEVSWKTFCEIRE